MKTCSNCQNRTCLTESKRTKDFAPCPEIEQQLRRSGIYSRAWIRPRISPLRTAKENSKDSNYLREIPVSDIDKTAEVRAFKLRFNRKPINSND